MRALRGPDADEAGRVMLLCNARVNKGLRQSDRMAEHADHVATGCKQQ